jgi:hypothetical protein
MDVTQTGPYAGVSTYGRDVSPQDRAMFDKMYNGTLETPGSETTFDGKKQQPLQRVFLSDYQKNEASIVWQQNTISQLNKLKPTEQQLTQKWSEEVNRVFDQRVPEVIAQYKRMGASEDMIKGVESRLAAERSEALDSLTGAAKSLTGPDPEGVNAVLSNLYTPDRMQDVVNKTINPGYQMLGTLIGGGLALATGNPGLAPMAAQIGGGVGQMVGSTQY